MPLVMAVATGHLIRTGRGGLLFKSFAVFCHAEFFRKRHAILIRLCSWDRSTNLQVPCVMGAINSLLDPEVYD